MKKKCIISIRSDVSDQLWPEGNVMKVPENVATIAVANKQARYTTKAKLKSFMNQQRRLNNNLGTVKRNDTITGNDTRPFRFSRYGIQHGKAYYRLKFSLKNGRIDKATDQLLVAQF